MKRIRVRKQAQHNALVALCCILSLLRHFIGKNIASCEAACCAKALEMPARVVVLSNTLVNRLIFETVNFYYLASQFSFFSSTSCLPSIVSCGSNQFVRLLRLYGASTHCLRNECGHGTCQETAHRSSQNQDGLGWSVTIRTPCLEVFMGTSPPPAAKLVYPCLRGRANFVGKSISTQFCRENNVCEKRINSVQDTLKESKH